MLLLKNILAFFPPPCGLTLALTQCQTDQNTVFRVQE